MVRKLAPAVRREAVAVLVDPLIELLLESLEVDEDLPLAGVHDESRAPFVPRRVHIEHVDAVVAPNDAALRERAAPIRSNSSRKVSAWDDLVERRVPAQVVDQAAVLVLPHDDGLCPNAVNRHRPNALVVYHIQTLPDVHRLEIKFPEHHHVLCAMWSCKVTPSDLKVRSRFAPPSLHATHDSIVGAPAVSHAAVELIVKCASDETKQEVPTKITKSMNRKL